jgi:linearmycin/streptolysin S transport system permease protein
MSQLGKVLAIGRVNLVRQVRDRGDLFFVFVLPTIIVVALGLQFGGPTTARLGIVAPTGDPGAEAIVADLSADGSPFTVTRVADVDALVEGVQHGTLEAGLEIPAGFSTALAGTETVEVRYIGTADSVVTGLRAPVEAAVAKAGAITTASRVVVAEGLAGWSQANEVAEAGYGAVPGVEVSVTEAGEAGFFDGFSRFTLGATTQLVLFIFLTSLAAAGRLVTTKQLGVSRRMLSTPTPSWTIVAGETVGRYLVALLQAVSIVAVSTIVFGVSWGDPVAAAAIVALFCLVAAGAAMLIGAVASNGDQASSIGVFAGLALGALGGCMIPFQVMPAAMQSIARLIPHSWAVLGLQSLIRDGGGISSIAPNLAVLGAWAVALLVLATWRFRRSIAG